MSTTGKAPPHGYLRQAPASLAKLPLSEPPSRLSPPVNLGMHALLPPLVQHCLPTLEQSTPHPPQFGLVVMSTVMQPPSGPLHCPSMHVCAPPAPVG